MFDILIRDAWIADGTGCPIYPGSVGVSGGKVSYIGPGQDLKGEKTIDAGKRFVAAPGFIDTHCHEDFYLFHDSAVAPKLRQGVTTIINGNCGCSAAPVRESTFQTLRAYFNSSLHGIRMPDDWNTFTTFEAYLSAVRDRKPGINAGFLVGHGTVRIAAMGFANRKADEKELLSMERMVEEAMESGALGMSSGLIYAPGAYASNDEILRLCRIVKKYEGVYATHMKNEGKLLVESVKESIDAARKTGVKLLISHLKVSGFENRALLEPALSLIEEARAEGLCVAMDQYPYNSGCTGLDALLPPEYLEGGIEEMLLKLTDPNEQILIRQKILDPASDWENIILDSGFDNIVILSAENSEGAAGKTIREYADARGKDPMDTFFDLLIKSGGHARCAMYYAEEESVEKIFRHPLTMIGSDSELLGEKLLIHPRGYGAYPKILGRLIREKQIMPLEQAVNKMTARPAKFFSIRNKGLLRQGYDADLVLFDPDTVLDTATFIDPWGANHGIAAVILNGCIAVENNRLLNAACGQVITNDQPPARSISI